MSPRNTSQYSVAQMQRHNAQPVISETIWSGMGVERPAEDSRHSSRTTETGASMREDQKLYCMHSTDCDTGSEPREAISHLFGRNKACTRRIPNHVWVYYCRKHYQRSRYQEAEKFPRTQIELFKRQVLRLQDWSEKNSKLREGDYIRSWTLSLRKREQNRIEYDGDYVADTAAATVPDWLFPYLGPGHTTEVISSLTDRLHQQIMNGGLAQVPEIEFLPDIIEVSSGSAGTKSARANGRRRSRMPSRSSGFSNRTTKRKRPKSRDLSGSEAAAYQDGRGESEIYHLQQHHRHHCTAEDTDNLVSPPSNRARLVQVLPFYGPTQSSSTQLPPIRSVLFDGELLAPLQATCVPTDPSSGVQLLDGCLDRSSHHGDGPAPSSNSYYLGQSVSPGGGSGLRWDGYELSPQSARIDRVYALSNGGELGYHQGAPPQQTQQRRPALPPVADRLILRSHCGGASLRLGGR
ncbi:hypothetical protein LEL_10550 [Akanthomyces lecanii RCEF 1005]|uniref:ORP1 like protein n=1 Tax=Akanthomyces lecanii RCEF 1005 TaxID=1081108 RepID=A0A167XKX5_CORDF|nr:hypothetical protein LEL_10550 [Akanthomyces lecanii RCEF 1005]